VNYLEVLKLAAPETLLVVTALIVLAADLLALRELELRMRLLVGSMIGCLGCVAAIAWMFALPVPPADLAEGMLVVNPLTHFDKIALLCLEIFSLLL